MRIKRKINKKKFALFPVRCELCGDYVWLEWYCKHVDRYGDVTMYCSECNQFKDFND